jgi:hypothetical protein
VVDNWQAAAELDDGDVTDVEVPVEERSEDDAVKVVEPSQDLLSMGASQPEYIRPQDTVMEQAYDSLGEFLVAQIPHFQ